MRSYVAACLLLSLAFAVGCGESEQAKAEKMVCEAKTKIASSVQSLQSLTIANASVSTVQSDVKAIEEALTEIQGAAGKLSGARKEQVEKANAALSEELTRLMHELTSLTLPQAQAQITAAANKLATSYKQALAPIEC
jgi:DNA repair ATPase RecN